MARHPVKKLPRYTRCYDCKEPLDSQRNDECDECGWIECPKCGSCGCTYEDWEQALSR